MKNFLKRNWLQLPKNTVVLLAVFLLIGTWADNSMWLLSDNDVFVVAVSSTVVIAFVWSKIARRFEL